MTLKQSISSVESSAVDQARKIASPEDLEQFRIAFLSRKGSVAQLFDRLKEISSSEKPSAGKDLNELRATVQRLYDEASSSLALPTTGAGDSDLTLPGRQRFLGTQHPITRTLDEFKSIFVGMGFSIVEGPEVESDYYNFESLNFPPEHPARDMQDTFFLKRDPDVVLRTHTSPVQIRFMQAHKPPIRIIAPGRVYRVDSDSTHSPVFHQVEGLYIAKGVSFAEMKQTLFYFAHEMFGKDVQMRFRPSFFPFTEPSAEMDISWEKDGKKSWLEIMGCGMVDPIVLENCKIDPDVYTGYAFGIGIERIAMLKFGIPDIRLFYENDLRFLKQFAAVS